jgi:hypothetical protein
MNEYLANNYVKKHFSNPKEAWNKAASPGQSGIPYLVESIKNSLEANTKVNQLKSNLNLIFAELKTHLNPYFIGDDITKARSLAEERAKKRLISLGKEMATRYSLPQILDQDKLSISDKTIGMIFDSVLNPMGADDKVGDASGIIQSENPVFEESIFQVVEAPVAEKEKKPAKTPAKKGEIFAQSVLNRWQDQLAHLTQDTELHEQTGLSPEWFAEITQEIIKGASRVDMEKRIATESDSYLNAPNATKFLRKTSVRVASILNKFIIELGQERAEKPIPSGPPKATLSAKAYPGLAIYQHWASSLIQMFKDNVAEASADDEQSNIALEKILKSTLQA